MSDLSDFMNNPVNEPKKRSYKKKNTTGANLAKTEEDLFKRVPPHNADAESAVLSGAFLRPELLNDILDTVSAADFYFPGNKAIFRAITELYSRNVNPDIVTVLDWLQNNNLLEEAGGAERLAMLAESVVSGANAKNLFCVRSFNLLPILSVPVMTEPMMFLCSLMKRKK